MKSAVFAILICLVFAQLALGQVSPSSLAKVFDSLGTVQVQNEILILDVGEPKVVVLSQQGSRESISLYSLTDGNIRNLWHLAKLPDFMAAINPSNLRVVKTDNGPVILLHGCARHLCGGKGLAGALAYEVNAKRLYTVFASWSSQDETTKIVYSPEDSTPEFKAQKKLLDNMLRDENYTP